MNIQRTLLFWIIAGMLTATARSQSLKFTVLVLDALDGKPQAGVIVRYFCEGKGFNPKNEVQTGSNGKADVPYACEEKARIELSLEVPNEIKEECGGVDAMRISDILAHGFISAPNGAGGIWCPTKQSRKVEAVPGQVTVFIKKPTWWQSHMAG